jgi:hypothetical protein
MNADALCGLLLRDLVASSQRPNLPTHVAAYGHEVGVMLAPIEDFRATVMVPGRGHLQQVRAQLLSLNNS